MSPFLRVLCISSSHLLRLLVIQTTSNPSSTAFLAWDIKGLVVQREGGVLSILMWRVTIWGHLSWLCPLPSPCALPGSSLVGWGEEQRAPWLCGLQEWKHHCVTNIVLSTHPKHSPEQAINPLPPQTSTLGFFLPQKIPSRGTLV